MSRSQASGTVLTTAWLCEHRPREGGAHEPAMFATEATTAGWWSAREEYAAETGLDPWSPEIWCTEVRVRHEGKPYFQWYSPRVSEPVTGVRKKKTKAGGRGR